MLEHPSGSNRNATLAERVTSWLNAILAARWILTQRESHESPSGRLLRRLIATQPLRSIGRRPRWARHPLAYAECHSVERLVASAFRRSRYLLGHFDQSVYSSLFVTGRTTVAGRGTSSTVRFGTKPFEHMLGKLGYLDVLR